MGRKYTGRVAAITVPATNAFEVFRYEAPTTGIAKIKEIVCGITGTADFGDAQAEGLDIQFRLGVGSTAGSGGSTPTLNKHEKGDDTAEGSLRASDTTVSTAGGGSLTTIRDEPFNLQVGFRYQPPEGLEYVLSPGDELCVVIPVGPSDELTTSFYASIVVEEIGGS